jgi:hypothetical protein
MNERIAKHDKNFLIIDLMIRFIQLAFLIYTFKDLINESFAIVYQLEE